MNTPHTHSPYRSEPLALLRREADSPHSDLTCTRFEFSSRGDRVPGQLLLPRTAGGPFPLVLVQTGELRPSASSFSQLALEWARSGAAVVRIDLPLHGERASAKLTARLCGGLGQPDHADSVWQILWSEFLRQAANDAGRSLDAASAIAAIDPARIVCVASQLACIAAAHCCAEDPRPRALALAPGEAKAGAAELRALDALGGVAPRPVLVVESAGSLASALFDAAREPKHGVAGAAAADGETSAAIDPFVREQLGL